MSKFDIISLKTMKGVNYMSSAIAARQTETQVFFVSSCSHSNSFLPESSTDVAETISAQTEVLSIAMISLVLFDISWWNGVHSTQKIPIYL